MTESPANSSLQVKEKPPAVSKRTVVSILVPVYNEYYHIEHVIERILNAPMPDLVDKEIILVDDGSTDGTSDILKKYKKNEQIHVFYAGKNKGKGWAIRTGLPHATGDIILIQDGDHEYNPAELHRLVTPILNGKAKVVYGSRFLGSVENMYFQYWLVNKLLVLAVRLLYGVRLTDEATAYKGFDSSVIHNLPLHCKRFEFCPEVTAKVLRLGFPIYEVPINYSART